MKRNLKMVLTMLFAAVFVLNTVQANVAVAAAPDKTAYLAYADESWTYQYWGEPVDTGVEAVDTLINGPGQYSVALDFSKTADGAAKGIAFTAPIIANGSVDFPGYFIQIDSVNINGKDIAITKGYTSSDDDVELRSNIYNTWVAKLPDDARTPDGSLEGASAVIVDPAEFEEVTKIVVNFTVLDADGNSAKAETTAPADKNTVPKTGVDSLSVVYGLGALVSGIAVLKRKK